MSYQATAKRKFARIVERETDRVQWPVDARFVSCCYVLGWATGLPFSLFVLPPSHSHIFCHLKFVVSLSSSPLLYTYVHIRTMSRDSWVGMATWCGLDGHGSIPDRGEKLFFFFAVSRPAPPSVLSSGYGGSFPGVKAAGLKLNTHIHLVPRSRMAKLYLHSHTSLWRGA
jgi:hypothetical protein